MPRPEQRFLPAERRAVMGLAGILSLRMLGFYALLPVLSTYAAGLPGARSLWIGMTVGVYGLTQAMFQIPMGVVSDRRGRRKAIVAGLLIFALGSFIAASAGSIWILLIGRFIQGAGAVASVLIALAADLTRPVARTRAMAFLGLAIGLSFGIGFVIGPPAAERFGVPALFNLTGILSLVAAAYVWTLIPERDPTEELGVITWSRAMEVLRRRELIILNLGTMTVHLCLTCIFVVVPIALEKLVAQSELWRIYLPVVAPALGLMYIAARRADHPGWARPILWMGTTLLAAGCLVMALLFPRSELPSIVIGIVIITWGIVLVEPILPALLTRFTPPETRGTAAGVFNMHQFGGSFLGGIVGGASLAFGLRPLFIALAALLMLWTVLAFRLPNPFRVEIARRRQERAETRAERKRSPHS